MSELTFTITPDQDGWYVAQAQSPYESIITQWDDIMELKSMIQDATRWYFFDNPSQQPQSIRLSFEEQFLLTA